ncbi:MAG TPA: hypothetical protein VGC30_08615 [Dokdonella sp.]
MTNSQPSRRAFPITRWSMVTQVFAAGERAPLDALDELGRRYRYAVYAYVRCCGHAPAIALGITQSFLHHLKRDFDATGRLRPNDRERFRRYLLERLHGWLADDGRRAHDDGGDEPPPPRDDFEARYARDGASFTSPEQAFQRGFALEVLVRAFERLRAEVRQTGHLDMYDALAPFIACDPPPGQYEEVAQALRTRPLAVVVALKRLRQRLRELANEELADTVSSAEELADEQRTLLSVLQTAN